jgi:hypothetical protein
VSKDEVKAAVRQETKEHLLEAWRCAPEYLDRYVEQALAGKQMVSGTTMHPLLAKLCKDVALDVLTAQRVSADLP